MIRRLLTRWQTWRKNRRDLRFRYEQVLARAGYQASELNNLSKKLQSQLTTRTADQIASAEGAKLRRICRSLVRNNAVAKRCQDFWVDRLVGEHGPRCQVGTRSERFNTEVERRWKSWCGAVDVREALCLTELLSMAVREYFSAGEFLAERGSIGKRFVVVPHESEDLTETSWTGQRVTAGNVISEGIEFNAIGVPVAYHFVPVMPGTQGRLTADSRRVDSGSVIHIYDRQRPSQFRGIPVLATVANTLFDVQDADLAELTASRLAACMGLFLKTDLNPEDVGTGMGSRDAEFGTDGPDSDPVTIKEIDFSPGAVNIGNYDATLIDPNRPGGTYLPFTSTLLKKAVSALNVPYSAATGDTSQSNYSTERATAMYAVTMWRYHARMVVLKLSKWTFKEWLYNETILNGLALPSGETVESVCQSVRWSVPGYEWIDPKAEGSRLQTELDNRLKSWGDVCGELGMDWKEQLDKIAEENAAAEKLGVVLPTMGAPAGMQPAAPDEPETTDDAKDKTDGSDDGTKQAAKPVRTRTKRGQRSAA